MITFRHLIVTSILSTLLSNVHSKPLSITAYSKEIKTAKEYLNNDKSKEALAILLPVAKTTNSADTEILVAQSYAGLDQTEMALKYYQLALKSAKNSEEKRVAHFGIAKSHMALSNYVRAKNTYLIILQEPLSQEDYQLALAGLVKSLDYLEQPRIAYRTIPCGIEYHSQDLVVASAQASLDAGWYDITQNVLTNNAAIIQKIKPNSAIDRDLQNVLWQTRLATNPNNLTPSFYYSSDSESFIIRHATLDYRHYWNYTFQTHLGTDYIVYTQSNKLIAKGFYIQQDWNPTRNFAASVNLEPIAYSHWHPLLWEANLNFTPNDYINVKAIALREIVETFPAFYQRISDNQFSLGLRLNPIPYFAIDSSVTRLNFSDNNFRNGYYISGIVQIFNDLGLAGFATQRGFTDKFQAPEYFSPNQYVERKAGLTLARNLWVTWKYFLNIAIGRQYITQNPGDPTASSPTRQWGLGIRGPISKHFVFSADYENLLQASSFRNSADYKYQYANVSLDILL